MKLTLAALFLISAVWGSVSGETEEINKLASASNDFAFKLLRKLESGENLFISPISIFMALSMLFQGARAQTAQEIRQTLSYDFAGLNEDNLNQNIRKLLSSIVPSSDQYILDISNAMLFQDRHPVRNEYKEILEQYFGAVLKEVDFLNNDATALAEINNWVRNKTSGKIQKLFESLDPRAVLVILNAVYFKSAWEVEFSRKETRDSKYYNKGVDPVTVPMMNGREKFLYWEDESSSAVKLPYKGGNVSMVLILPNQRDGLSKLEQQLNSAKFKEILRNMTNIFVTTNIPRFKLEYFKELKPILRSLGMNRVFTDGANLSGISEEGGLQVSSVVHKAYLEVNEEGSEAAGATGIEIIPYSSFVPKKYSFIADHPFLFFIRDERTGIILFAGRVSVL